MTVELESGLEEKLLEDLRNNGYERITIKDNKELEENFKKQLENFNEIKLTNEEFDEILRELKKGTIFDKAQLLRDSYTLKRKNKPNKWIYFINKEEWCKNIFQVTNQIKSNNKYDHRYDVTILINGLPLVQIELKKKGVELKKAFNQIKQRYLPNFKGLFQYIQIFIITNSVNTKYFATGNARSIKYESTYFWKDKKNKNIKQLSDFTKTFLEPCTLAKMITKFMILNESDKKIMILRAYQKYAVEEIIRYAIDIKQNGYIYHTTGSGKTLTSYKTSQLLTEYPEINKVIFVVDRKDLDTQTIRKFNEYSEDDIKQVNNTNALIRKLISEDKLIVTTIQKLDNVVRKHQTKVNKMKNKKIIFIYDECHRSQFGKMHQRITNYFQNNLCFGFTGTPIFTENSNGLQTTKSIFGKQLHRYMIKDAIRDKNVLGFSIKYYGKGKNKSNKDSKVKKIDTNEWLLNNNRIEQNVNKIIETYPYKTQDGKFNAMLTINRGDMIDKYYKLLKEKAPNLNIAVIYTPDENNSDENEKSNEEYIKEYIKDYNKLFETNFTTETKDEYRINISNKMETGEIDLLIVKDMFTTGFDCPRLNTLYVDKNLEYHKLLQTFSRTNRIYDKTKAYGNIICFRNLKENTDKALHLFSDNAPLEDIILEDYKIYVERFNEAHDKLLEIAKTPKDAGNLESETEMKKFVERLREINRIKKVLETFPEFTYDKVNMTEDEHKEYLTVYLDIHDTKCNEKTSILNDIDFELELIHEDTINVDYILELINADITEPYAKQSKKIEKIMDKEPQLRSKKDLIQKFLKKIYGTSNPKEISIEEEYEQIIEDEKRKAFCNLIEEENLKEDKIRDLINEYYYTEKIDRESIEKTFKEEEKLGFVKRVEKIDRVQKKFLKIMKDYN